MGRQEAMALRVPPSFPPYIFQLRFESVIPVDPPSYSPIMGSK